MTVSYQSCGTIVAIWMTIVTRIRRFSAMITYGARYFDFTRLTHQLSNYGYVIPNRLRVQCSYLTPCSYLTTRDLNVRAGNRPTPPACSPRNRALQLVSVSAPHFILS